MPGGISAGWRMLSAFGGATGELVALLAKEGGGGAAGKLLYSTRISREEYRSTAFPINNRWNVAQQRTYSAPQYTVGTCVLAAVMGAYFKVRAAVGDGQPRAEVPGSLSADAKPSSADAQRLKAIDEGTCGRS